MKLFNTILILATILFSGCHKDEETHIDDHTHNHGNTTDPTNDSINTANGNTLTLKFEHMVGTTKLLIDDSNATTYRYQNSKSQDYNVTKFGYYISNIILHGMNSNNYADSVSVSADKVKGIYLVSQKPGTDNIESLVIGNIPTGHYTKITFTIGVPENEVQQGAAGGVLDPAAGAWFWSWNAGYVSTKIEGISPQSSSSDKTISYHIGGWKDVAVTTGSPKFVNNIQTVTLDFGSTHAMVASNTAPSAHIIVDAAKLIDGSNIDFSVTPAVHSPAAGKVFADQIPSTFIFDHIHN